MRMLLRGYVEGCVCLGCGFIVLQGSESYLLTQKLENEISTWSFSTNAEIMVSFKVGDVR